MIHKKNNSITEPGGVGGVTGGGVCSLGGASNEKRGLVILEETLPKFQKKCKNLTGSFFGNRRFGYS